MAIVSGDDLLKVLQRLEDVLIADAAGTAVTIANGADVTQGALADAAVGDASGSVNAHLRNLNKALVLPAGASTAAKQDTGNTSLAAVAAALAAALPLPTGASTAAKQDMQHADLAAILAGPVPVSGAEANGGTPALNPVQIAVLNSSGKLAPIQLDGSSSLPIGGRVQGYVTVGQALGGYAPFVAGAIDGSGNVAALPLPVPVIGAGDGLATVAVAAGTVGDQVINNKSGRLCRVLITAAGVGILKFYDNAAASAGTVIGIFLANPAIGTVQEFAMPAANGITAGGGATMPGYTVSYS